MKIVADENIDFLIIKKLRDLGFDVFSIAEATFGISDRDVLKTANNNSALLLTEDKDFGELVYRFKLPNRGVLLIRLSDDLPRQTIVNIAIDVILKYNESLFDCFTVLSDDKIRIKKYKN